MTDNGLALFRYQLNSRIGGIEIVDGKPHLHVVSPNFNITWFSQTKKMKCVHWSFPSWIPEEWIRVVVAVVVICVSSVV